MYVFVLTQGTTSYCQMCIRDMCIKYVMLLILQPALYANCAEDTCHNEWVIESLIQLICSNMRQVKEQSKTFLMSTESYKKADFFFLMLIREE